MNLAWNVSHRLSTSSRTDNELTLVAESKDSLSPVPKHTTEHDFWPDPHTLTYKIHLNVILHLLYMFNVYVLQRVTLSKFTTFFVPLILLLQQ